MRISRRTILSAILAFVSLLRTCSSFSVVGITRPPLPPPPPHRATTTRSQSTPLQSSVFATEEESTSSSYDEHTSSSSPPSSRSKRDNDIDDDDETASTSSSSRPTATTTSTSSNNKDIINGNNVLTTPSAITLSYEKQIVKLGRQGKTDTALQLFGSLERPTLRQVNAALDACGRANPPRLQACLDIFQQHFGNSKNNNHRHYSHHLKPNVYTFGAVMAACARAGNVDQAMHVLNTMESSFGVVPNAVVYHSAITACARAVPRPRVDLALQLLQQAREKNNKNSTTSSGSSNGTSSLTTAKIGSLTVVGYNAAVAAAARAGDYQTAMQILEEMECEEDLPDSDAVTYGTVMAACEKSERWEVLLQVARRMQNRGFVLDGMAYTSVLHACQQLGLASEAIEYLEQMKHSTKSYQRTTAGRQVAGSLPPLRGPDAVAYRLTISACARGRAWKEAIRVLDDYCLQGGGADDVVAYTAAISGCEYVGEWKTAFQLLERMRQTGAQPNEVTFAAVIGACATACANGAASSGKFNYNGRAPNSDESPLPLRKALQLLQVLKKDDSVPDPNIHVYNAAIRACGEALDVKKALSLLNDLRHEGLEPSIVTYGCLMTACERVGSTTAASKVFKLLREDGLDANEIIYGAAISCCRKAGERERALLLLKKMIRDEKKPNVAVFNTVLMALTEANPSDQDIDNALMAYKILRQYPKAVPNRQTYNMLIRALAAQRQPRQAEKLLKDMREDGLVPDVDLFTAAITSYERLGQPLKALNLMESMREEGYDFYESAVLNTAFKKAVKLVNAVGRGLAVPGDEEEAAF